jgi:cyclopropane-fatty-acyl-phospholipid synthase
MSSQYLIAVQKLLAGSDVQLDGSHPWDIKVRDPVFAQRILASGSLGVGESYMDAQWECERLDEMLFRVVRAGIDERLPGLKEAWAALRARLVNLQSQRRSFIVGERHYDIGDDLYERMLDRRMIYSCAYWRSAQSLDEAQEAKLDLVCRKLGLQPGMKVLDIGCGWGGAAEFAASRYGVSVTGLTVSKHQAESAARRCNGLKVDIQLRDYRDATGTFDRIYSLGMFEHVGARNYARYFRTVRRLLAYDGLFLLHTIGSNATLKANDPWIDKYIFPNSMIPSIAQIAVAAEQNFVTEDWHNFGPDYDRTLMNWAQRFETHWSEIADRYGERFRRMWTFWLMASAAYFRARRNQLWQVVFSPHGVRGGYEEVR